MKKSTKIRVVSLVAALMMLMGAIAYAAINGSPYETLKKAGLDALTEGNKTIQGHVISTLNGSPEEEWIYIVDGGEALLSYHYDDYGSVVGYTYETNGLKVSPRSHLSDEGVQWYYAGVYPRHDNYRASDIYGIPPEERNSARMRFIELLADALIGDLKNNCIMSSSGGIRHISCEITESQMPELYRAGIDMIIEQDNIYKGYFGGEDAASGYYPIAGNYTNMGGVMDKPLESVVMDYFRGEADVDVDGNLLYIGISASFTLANIFHETDTREVRAELHFSDHGISVAACPIPGAEEVFSYENMKARFGRVFGSIYFTLKADGSIDEDSITTDHPGDRDIYGGPYRYDPLLDEEFDEGMDLDESTELDGSTELDEDTVPDDEPGLVR